MLVVQSAPKLSSHGRNTRTPLTTATLCCTQALLWTDGRYHLQADQQLGAGWTLMKAGKPSVPTIQEFLAKRLPKDARVGIDPFVHSVSSVNALEKVRASTHVYLLHGTVFSDAPLAVMFAP